MRGVDVITAYEDNASKLADSTLLSRASELGRVLFSHDDDLLVEAVKRLKEGEVFNGVIYAHHLKVSIGVCNRDLEIIAKAGEPEDMINRVYFLPF